jgi:intracellular sulfur oxidation DsrE/DsrF family protein
VVPTKHEITKEEQSKVKFEWLLNNKMEQYLCRGRTEAKAMKEETLEKFITSIIMVTPKLMNIAAKNTNYSIQVDG